MELCSQGTGERKGLQAVPGEAQAGHQEEFLRGKGAQALQGTHIPAGVRGKPGRGTQGWGQGGDRTQLGLSGLGGFLDPQ